MSDFATLGWPGAFAIAALAFAAAIAFCALLWAATRR